MFIIIVFWLGSDRPSWLFFSCCFISFHAQRLPSCLLLFLCLISFLLFPCTSVCENTRAGVTPHFLAHTEWWYLFFLEMRYVRSKSRLSETKYNNNSSLSKLCTIGGTSRATYGIPAKQLNITIYTILYHRWFLELQQQKQS